MSSYKAIQIDTGNTRYSSSPSESGSKLGDRALYANVINGKRYYSSIDAEIYIGETYIDDVVQISWAIDQATMPLYGYNSYTFDDVAVGARQISGNFVINFTKSGFMYEVLSKTKSLSRSSLYTDSEAKYQLEWSSYNEKEHMPGWNRSFNIVIGYGDYKASGSNESVTVLRCVQLTGCQQVLSADGGPIGEVYSFIAKDIRYDIGVLPETTSVENIEANSNEEEETAFTFSVESAVVKYDTSIVDPRLFAGRLRYDMKYKSENGVLVGIRLMLKNYKSKILNTAYYDIGIGKDSEINHIINMGIHTAVIKAYNEQKEDGARDNQAYMFYDLIIDYQVGEELKQTTLSNQKVFINEVK